LLFKKAYELGELVDGPVLKELDTAKHTMTLWLAMPKTLRIQSKPDSSTIKMDARKVVRFYFRGESKRGLEHIKVITSEVKESGHSMSDKIWVTQLSLWNNSPTSLTEYCIELK